MPTDTEYTVDDFMAALSGQESGGNWEAENTDTGAYGRWQILPSNWPSWAEEAGLGRNAEQTPENQAAVARFKMQQYYDDYGSWDAVAVAWFAGPDRARRYVQGDTSVLSLSDGNMTVGEYIDVLQNALGTVDTTDVQAAGGTVTPLDTSDDDTFDGTQALTALFTNVSEAIRRRAVSDDGARLADMFETVTTPTGSGATSAGAGLALPSDTADFASEVETEAETAPTGAGAYQPEGGEMTVEAVTDWAGKIADAFGLNVSSVGRDHEHNERVGGATNSDHLIEGGAFINGGAADIYGDDAAQDRLYEWAQQYEGPGKPFRIVIDEGDHIHISFNRDATSAPLFTGVDSNDRRGGR